MSASAIATLLISAILVPSALLAQASPADSAEPGTRSLEVRLSFAPQYRQVGDDLLFGLRTEGVLPVGSLGASLRHSCGKLPFAGLSLAGGFGTLSNRFDQTATIGDAALRLDYLPVALFVRDERSAPWIPSPVLLGLQAQASTLLQFYADLDEAHIYWLTAYEIGPSVLASIATGDESLLSARLALPLMAAVSRPDEHRLYNNDVPEAGEILTLVNSNLRLALPGAFHGADVEITYGFGISDRWSEAIGYRLAWRTATEPRTISSVSHTLHITLGFTP